MGVSFFWILRFTPHVEERAAILDIGDGCTVVTAGGVRLGWMSIVAVQYDANGCAIQTNEVTQLWISLGGDPLAGAIQRFFQITGRDFSVYGG